MSIGGRILVMQHILRDIPPINDSIDALSIFFLVSVNIAVTPCPHLIGLKPFLRQNLLVIKDLLQVQSHLVVVFSGDLVSIRQILV